MMKRFLTHCTSFGLLVICSFLSLKYAYAQQTTADSVRAEFLHAWNGYKEYAWGHDELKPLTKQPHDWYPASLCMTPVDAYDAMVIMNLRAEAAEAKKLILDTLSFDRNFEVQSFEVTIRLLGGLLSAYELDGDQKFLALADDLGKRLLPVFNSSTGMPYRYVNLQTGKIRDSINNPAEIGTSVLEFGTLGKLTGNPLYYSKAKNAVVQLFRRRSHIGLVGTWINVETGAWVDSTSHIGGAIDSYYEYLMKTWLLFGDQDFKNMWDESITAINRYVADSSRGLLWYGQVNMETGRRVGTTFGSLEAFFPALLCLSGDVRRAAALETSCYTMWNLEGIEPEEIDYTTMHVNDQRYFLRPEIIESAYYLFHATGDSKYQQMGETFFHSLIKYCRTDEGYAYLTDISSGKKGDSMQSFFLAETLKYLYLLFAPPDAFAFDRYIFNTEAHPLQRPGR